MPHGALQDDDWMNIRNSMTLFSSTKPTRNENVFPSSHKFALVRPNDDTSLQDKLRRLFAAVHEQLYDRAGQPATP